MNFFRQFLHRHHNKKYFLRISFFFQDKIIKKSNLQHYKQYQLKQNAAWIFGGGLFSKGLLSEHNLPWSFFLRKCQHFRLSKFQDPKLSFLERGDTHMLPIKTVQFSSPPSPILSSYVQNSPTPLISDAQFQTNPSPFSK